MFAWFASLQGPVQAAIITLTVGGGLGGGGTWLYNIGYGNGARDISQVEKYKDQVASLLVDLNKVSESVHQTTKMIDENANLKAQAATDGDKLKTLQQTVDEQITKLKAATDKVVVLEGQLGKLVPDDELTKVVQQGTAERVIPNGLTIGVNDFIADFAAVRINGYGNNMHVGDNERLEILGKSCLVELVKIDKPSATFVISCFKIQSR